MRSAGYGYDDLGIVFNFVAMISMIIVLAAVIAYQFVGHIGLVSQP